ncbi:MAG TPA: hypothetical protein ENN76_02805 [Euryarchaeota archaeon]|nr:hypothetical protein [Euryarchaeota archaeon]
MDEGIKIVGQLMKLSAKTAPKAMGQDMLELKFVMGEEKDIIARDMLNYAKEHDNPGYTRDGNNLKEAKGCLLIGLKRHSGLGLNCGACGFSSCEEMSSAARNESSYEGPNCAIRVTDLGIALGSAVKTATDHNVDNRIMYRIGTSVIRLRLMDASIVYGIPLSATGKNIFFDRK